MKERLPIDVEHAISELTRIIGVHMVNWDVIIVLTNGYDVTAISTMPSDDGARVLSDLIWKMRDETKPRDIPWN